MTTPEEIRRQIAAFCAREHAAQVLLLAELVKVPSDNPPGDCALHAERAAALLEELGFTVERHPVPDDLVRANGMISAINLIVRERFGAGPTVALNAHGDVVPPGEGWTADPYGAEIRDGWMYGRGVAVSKSDFATYVYALLALRSVGVSLAGTAELHLTYDEEAGGAIGPKWLLERGPAKPDFAISAGFSYGIVTAHNGCLHLEVLITGKSAHAARPETGHDALEAATRVLNALYEHRKGFAAIRSAVDGIVSPTLVVGLIRGGINTNVVPDGVTLRLDRRIIPEEDGAKVERGLRELIQGSFADVPGIGCEVRRIMLAEPLKPVPGLELLVAPLRRNAEAVFGEPIPTYGVPLYTDARHYAAAGIPTVLYGAGPRTLAEANAHAADERLPLADLRKATEVVALTLCDLLGERRCPAAPVARSSRRPAMNLDELLNAPVPPTAKGWPALAATLPLREAGRRGWNLLRADLPLPVAVLKASALAHNSRWMRRFLDHFDVRLCPHGKTTMAPQLFARQLADGAWGITVATVQQLMVCRRFGVPRVLMANQLVGRQAIRAVLAELQADPGFEFLCLVDSPEGVELLQRELEGMPLGRPFEVLLEGGVAGGRTGCRSIEEALAIARRIAAVPELALAGIEGFEDVIGGGIVEAEPKIAAFLEYLVELARACAREDLFAPGPVILSAGGSKYFDQVTAAFQAAALDRPVEIVLRSGCYLSHDSKIYTDAFTRLRQRTPAVERLGEGLRPALELWASVQSTPEPGLAILTLGKRDVSHDIDLPLARQWFRPGLHQGPQDLGPGFKVTGLYDQHTCLRVPADSPLRVGDFVSFGISHPCTTFDKWRLLYVVDDDYTVTEAIRTFF